MTFDTLAFCKRLQEGGVPPDQAEAHARAQADFLADYPLSEMTVKKDLEAVRHQEGPGAVRHQEGPGAVRD